MKQQINLYQVEKKQLKLDLTFQYMVWIFLAFLGILLMITVVDTVKYISAKDQLTKLQKEHAGKSKALQTISGQVPEERTREQLMNEIKKYQTEAQSKQEVLESLTTKLDNKNIFSDYLESLSKKTLSGLWFTKLSFKENGNIISLEGSAVKPEYLPNLIAALKKDSAFDGKEFELFKESLDEKTQQINFILETKSVKQP